MTTQRPHHLTGYTKPGRSQEVRFHAPETLQGDPPEYIAVCKACPLQECVDGSDACPLKHITLERRTKSGRPDMRVRGLGGRKTEPDETDRKIIRMYRNGGRVSWIARKLDICFDAVKERIRKLEKYGFL